MNIPAILEFIRSGETFILNGSEYSGLEWTDDTPKPSEEEIREAWPAVRNTLALNRVRAERDCLLVASDWTQVPDAPVEAKAWAAYRKALRDLPATIKDATADVEWPTPPE